MVFSSLPFYNHTAKIRDLCRRGTPAEAFSFYRLLRLGGLPSDALSLTFLLDCCAASIFLPGGTQIHAGTLKDGHLPDRHLLTAIMHLYSACRRFREVRDVFVEIPRPDVVTWNVLIGAYASNRCKVDALALFDVMQGPGWGVRPDEVTCVVLLQAAASLRALPFGERIHAYSEERRLDGCTALCNSLISMYFRCGRVDRAGRVFGCMPKRNVITWTAIISGLAANARGRDAVAAFWRMQAAGVSPDAHTFTGVLSACTSARLVDGGLVLLRLMTEWFGVRPNVRHYGCVVDLLARAGRLDRAYELAASMPVRPDEKIWRTLLDACGAHRYTALGGRVVRHIVELKAWEAGDHLLLLNLYSAAGRTPDLAKVRKTMTDRGEGMVPGCSTYQLRGRVHRFSAGDGSEPAAREIYEKLEEVMWQLRIGGYIPEMSPETRGGDVGPTEGRRHHSEKMAIVFGMMWTPPGMAVRVAKDRRVCADCHNFAKVFSRVYDREVVVMDRCRFHRFHSGKCLCRDYW